MFKCAYCKSEIDSDSFFCDQCGKEILLCEKCMEPRLGSWCEEDGEALVAAKSIGPAPRSSPGHLPTDVQAQPKTVLASAPTLRLVNSNLGISLDVKPGTLLGRSAGPHAGVLGQHNKISGQHLLVEFSADSGWTVKDMGSTNGTKWGRMNKAWADAPRMAPQVPVKLENNSFLLIANIEFQVQISTPSASNATERI